MEMKTDISVLKWQKLKIEVQQKEIERLKELIKTQNEMYEEVLLDKALKFKENTELKTKLKADRLLIEVQAKKLEGLE